MRLIDADALKAKLKIGTNTATYSDYCNGYMDARLVDLDAIDAAPTIEAEPVRRWIPCTERLPEKYVEVLAYSPYWGKIVVAMLGDKFWLEQWTDDDLEKSEISHWMPLPKPPEGGSEDV